MHYKNLTAVISGIVLLAAGAAHADQTANITTANTNAVNNTVQQHFISKRPYQQVVANTLSGDQHGAGDQQWEGATLTRWSDRERNNDSASLQQQTLRLAMLSKRPY